MPRYEANCEHCGTFFKTYRGPGKPVPRFCSYACYWATSEPAKNSPFVEGRNGPVKHRVKVYVGRDENGKPRYMQRSHWVWNQHHPDDPVQPGDHVHHIDLNKLNDDPSNLEKKPGAKHLSDHAKAMPSEQRAEWMRAYHAANSGRQRKGTTRTCVVCGKEFYRPPSASQETCSYTCMGKLSYQRRGGIRKDASE